MHGGSVTAHSDGLGKGAEFTIRLPLGEGAPAAVATGARTKTPTPRRVLVIEDNVDAANTLRDALELDEHEVAVAYDGSEGVEKARECKPEIVLCDIGLPGMDGYAVARALRADDLLKGAFLVALSGYAQPEDVQRASEAGFDRHIAKPPNFETLEQIFASLPPESSATRVARISRPGD